MNYKNSPIIYIHLIMDISTTINRLIQKHLIASFWNLIKNNPNLSFLIGLH